MIVYRITTVLALALMFRLYVLGFGLLFDHDVIVVTGDSGTPPTIQVGPQHDLTAKPTWSMHKSCPERRTIEQFRYRQARKGEGIAHRLKGTLVARTEIPKPLIPALRAVS